MLLAASKLAEETLMYCQEPSRLARRTWSSPAAGKPAAQWLSSAERVVPSAQRQQDPALSYYTPSQAYSTAPAPLLSWLATDWKSSSDRITVRPPLLWAALLALA